LLAPTPKETTWLIGFLIGLKTALSHKKDPKYFQINLKKTLFFPLLLNSTKKSKIFNQNLQIIKEIKHQTDCGQNPLLMM
jgi:hypothetical protein